MRSTRSPAQRALLAAVALLAAAAVARGCSCLPRTFPEHYCQSDVVMEVQFTSRRVDGANVFYLGTLVHVYKGTLATRWVQVVTSASSATCGVEFLVGCTAPTYLVTGSFESFGADPALRAVRVTSCNYYDATPSEAVRRFLRYPSCPCAAVACLPHQVCKLHYHPGCGGPDSEVANAGPEGVNAANASVRAVAFAESADAVAVDDDGTPVPVPVPVPCPEPYCADSCELFACPNDTVCRLVEVTCVRAPCPPVARCLPVDPCATVLCAPHYVCKVDEATRRPYCTGTCDDVRCAPGSHCELVEGPEASPLPLPVRHPRCVPDVPPAPCEQPIDRGVCPPGTGTPTPVPVAEEANPFPAVGSELNALETFAQYDEQDAVENFAFTAPPAFGDDAGDEGVLAEAPASDLSSLRPLPPWSRRWFFNKTSGECEPFVFEGCGGNENNFESEEECDKVCPPPDPCRLPADPGPCKAAIPRWFFNRATGRCERFVYGGCGGNTNNFETAEECEATCPPPDPCLLPRDAGAGALALPRFFYDAAADACVAFSFGGSGGNLNNFASADECRRRCARRCALPRVVGTGTQTLPRFWHNPVTGVCEPFVYSGAGGNANNFDSVVACEAACPPRDVCRRPKQEGPCLARIPRWWFNWRAGVCERFFWGGCASNGNNFETRAACEARCPPVDVCRLPADRGDGAARVARWFYNKLTRRCERFVYSGSGGNANNFATRRQCLRRCRPDPCIDPPRPCDLVRCRPHQQCRVWPWTGEPYCADTCRNFPCPHGTRCELTQVTCVRAPCPPVAQCVAVEPPVCEQPAAHGDGAEYVVRWFFNSSSLRCERFVYSGSGGNDNNFREQAHCVERCLPRRVCALPADAGPCDGAIPRWFHNATTGRCESFVYGGCGGNRNNFPTQDHCERVCPLRSPCEQPPAPFFCAVAPAVVRWYYDPRSNSCKTYGANECAGNDNEFLSEQACRACVSQDVCSLPPETGPCEAYVPSWHFDAATRTCRRFIYGGCGGNGNRFATEARCREACGGGGSRCLAPRLLDDCNGEAQLRFFFNAATGACEGFVYRGCAVASGGGNLFVSAEECEEACPPVDPCPPCANATAYAIQVDEATRGFCCRRVDGHNCCCPLVDAACRAEEAAVAALPTEPVPDAVVPLPVELISARSDASGGGGGV